MPFEQGHKKIGGRRKGSINKSTAKVKDSIIAAFEEVGGESYLAKVALDDPKTFCALLARLLPTEMKAEFNTKPAEEMIERLEKDRQRAALVQITSGEVGNERRT
jgi:hypothetical protein